MDWQSVAVGVGLGWMSLIVALLYLPIPFETKGRAMVMNFTSREVEERLAKARSATKEAAKQSREAKYFAEVFAWSLSLGERLQTEQSRRERIAKNINPACQRIYLVALLDALGEDAQAIQVAKESLLRLSNEVEDDLWRIERDDDQAINRTQAAEL